MDRIDALRLFLRLVERGSFSAAAKDVHIKQSTASKWLARLEEEYGVALVERTTRALRVTDAGQRLHATATELLGRYDSMAEDLRGGPGPVRGRVRLSVPVVFGQRFVAPLVADFLNEHPDTEAELVFSDRYVNLVEEGFDAAIRVGVPADTSARGRRLAQGARRLVASPAYLDAHGVPSAPADLAAHQCLASGDISLGDRWVIGFEGRTHTIMARGRISATHAGVLSEYAKGGFGVALLAEWMVRDALESGELRTVLEGATLPPAPVSVLLPPGRY
ncbi:MAG: LysR family transcriptional regulator, partial [Myxococcota bacterium]